MTCRRCLRLAAVILDGVLLCGFHALQASRLGHPQAAAVGKPASSGLVPSSTGRASAVASVTASEPGPYLGAA